MDDIPSPPSHGPASWASSPATRRSMQGNRSRDTRPELAIRSAVHATGLRYRVAARPIRGVRRSADLVFRSARVAVFVDGCFWHGCGDHFTPPRTNAAYWTAKIDGNRARDADTDARLAAHGWLVIRCWEHEDPRHAAARVHDLVRRQQALARDRALSPTPVPGPR
jgi:DNA mismatch endonuclease (patch repair protein)